MSDPSSQLGVLIRHRRDQLTLPIREVARRVGISSSYLVALEQGRNPSTGRPPVPSPPVLAAIGRALDVDLSVLLELVGVPTKRSPHQLLYQLGERQRSPLEAARRLFAGHVDVWFEVTDPRGDDDGRAMPDDVIARQRGPLGAADRGRQPFRLADPRRRSPTFSGGHRHRARARTRHRLRRQLRCVACDRQPANAARQRDDVGARSRRAVDRFSAASSQRTSACTTRPMSKNSPPRRSAGDGASAGTDAPASSPWKTAMATSQPAPPRSRRSSPRSAPSASHPSRGRRWRAPPRSASAVTPAAPQRRYRRDGRAPDRDRRAAGRVNPAVRDRLRLRARRGADPIHRDGAIDGRRCRACARPGRQPARAVR